MKDLDTWFYVIIFVFYIGAQIWKGLKKARQSQPAQQPVVPDSIPVGGKRQIRVEKRRKKFSFDDLVREFEEGFVQERQPEKQIELPPEIPEESTIPYTSGQLKDEPEFVSSFEEEKTYNSLFDEDMVVPESERNIKYRIKTKEENTYAKILKEPDGVKKAIILSEILNRKYI